jgi:AbrB family looped-hinge helix DNA binding protein
MDADKHGFNPARGVVIGVIMNLPYKYSLPYIAICGRLWPNERHIMNSAYVTSKGQLVVPSRIRRLFGIKPGTRINFVEEGDRIIFQPVTREYIRSFRGRFKQKPGEKSVVQEHLEERRAEREKENR